MKINIPTIKRKKPPEVRVLELVEEHVSLCVSISKILVKVANLKMTGIGEETENLMEELFKAEEEADSILREVETELAKGILPPLSREDLMRLIGKLNIVADSAKDAVRILNIVYTDELTEGFKIVFMRLVNKADKCVQALRDAVESLLRKYSDVLKKCYEVHRLEQEIDVIYIETLKVSRDSNTRIQTSLLVTELLRFLESEADACEDTSNLIRVITISALN
jgi:predicted phosphate transport protein (TIGR00153 family)